MRLRHIQGAEETIATSPFVIQEPEQHRGHFHELFGNDHPIRIEVGMGKGQFLMELATRHPEINFIGIERYSSVLLRAIQKREQLELSNIYFMCVDAKGLSEIFAPEEVERIYLNFSDPWPPNRQRKRRLTHSNFLALYDCVLAKNGQVHFKTDNQHLFEFTLEEMCGYGWLIQNICLDLHNSEQDNIMTEYEEKFSKEGFRIYRLEASRRDEDTLTRAHTPPRTAQQLAEKARGSVAPSFGSSQA